MRRVPRALLAVLCTAVLGGLLAAGPAGAALTIGLSDQQPATFADPLFRQTGITLTRYITPWNALSTDPAKLDRWMQAARAAGTDVMVAFNRATGSACPYSPCVLPTVDQYRSAVTAFLQKYPWVTTITPWNEVNDRGQPTNTNPARAAQYYQVVRQVCPSCTVLGADVIDNGTQLSWLSSFLKAVGTPPQLWGLHNYVDVNYFRSSGTESVLGAVPGEIWLTETGGLVRYASPTGSTTFPYDEDRAARAEAFLLSIADAHPDRITRLYHYEWRSGGATDYFDSALERQDGTPRAAFGVLLPRMPGRPDTDAATPGAATSPATTAPGAGTEIPATPPAAAATRPLIITRGRSRRPLKLRLACLAPAKRRCTGTLSVRGGGRARFSLRAGRSRTVLLRGRHVAKRVRVRVTLRAPARSHWTATPAVAVPHHG